MINSKKAARKWYSKIQDKDKVSQEFLRNAICFYEDTPQRTVNFLNVLPAERCERLDAAFHRMRDNAKEYVLQHKLSRKDEDEIFLKLVKGEIKPDNIGK